MLLNASQKNQSVTVGGQKHANADTDITCDAIHHKRKSAKYRINNKGVQALKYNSVMPANTREKNLLGKFSLMQTISLISKTLLPNAYTDVS
jgi:hypothetical protein